MQKTYNATIASAPDWIYSACNVENSEKVATIPVGRRHDSIKNSVRGYAQDTPYSFILLWKRVHTLVIKCTECAPDAPITFSELFEICLWAWNVTHPQGQLAHSVALKMLQGRAKNRQDIFFGPEDASIHSFHLKDSNISTTQHPNYSTSQ